MKRISTALLLLLTLGLAFPAFAQDETEEPTPTEEAAPEGDATEEAAPEGGSADSEIAFPLLVDGDVVEGELTADVTAQLFAFNATEGDVVTVSVTQAEDSELDPYLVLLGPAGEVIGYDDDSGQEVSLSSELADVELPFTGAYFVLVSSYTDILPAGDETSGVEGTYEVALSGATEPEGAGETVQFAGNELPLDGTEFQGYSTPEEPVFYFYFTGTEGQTLDVQVAPVDEAFDAALFVFDSNASRIAVVDAVEEGASIELPTDGDYFVFIADRGFISGSESVVGGDFIVTATVE